MSFMHFASQKSACLHFEHLVLAAFPHHSHIPDLDVRVLATELTPDWASDTLLGLLMTRQGGTRLGFDRASPPTPIEASSEKGVGILGLCVYSQFVKSRH